jgi:hypothetical protein
MLYKMMTQIDDDAEIRRWQLKRKNCALEIRRQEEERLKILGEEERAQTAKAEEEEEEVNPNNIETNQLTTVLRINCDRNS